MAAGGTLNWSGGNISGSLVAGGGAVVNWSGGAVAGPLTIATNGVLDISGTVNLCNALTNAGRSTGWVACFIWSQTGVALFTLILVSTSAVRPL